MSDQALSVLWFLAFGVYVVSILWAAADAQTRGKSGLVVALLVALAWWPIGLLIWLLIRPQGKVYSNWNRAAQSRRRVAQSFGAPTPHVIRSANLPMSGFPISAPLSSSASSQTSKIDRFCPRCGGLLRHNMGLFSYLDCDYKREIRPVYNTPKHIEHSITS